MRQENKVIPFYENKKEDFYYRNEETHVGKLACNAHIHRQTEFVYLKGGECIAHADTESFRLGEDDFFIAFPNQVHHYETLSKEGYYLFIVSPELLPELSGFFNNVIPKSNVLRNIKKNEELYGAIVDLAEAAEKEPSELRETLLKGRLLVFFSLLFAEMALVPYMVGDGSMLRTIVDYCANNFTQPLTLASLEENLHISKHYISHIFGDKLNIRFNDYINSLRITYAARLLRESDESIIDISGASGFNSPRTFNRAFKKHMGVSPRDYRVNKNSARLKNTHSPSL